MNSGNSAPTASSAAGSWIDGETVEWHSSYLKNKFETNREMIVAVLKSFELDSVVELSRLGAILDRNAEKMSVARRTGYPVRCFFCVGSGKYSKKIVNPQYRPNSAYARYIMKYEACAVCDGNGKRPLWPERLCFTVPPDVKEEMGKRITAAGEEFCGFHLGGEKKEELDRHIFYRKEPLYVVPNSFGETMFFAGNHQDRRRGLHGPYLHVRPAARRGGSGSADRGRPRRGARTLPSREDLRRVADLDPGRQS